MTCAHRWVTGSNDTERICAECKTYEIRVTLPGGRAGWVDVEKVVVEPRLTKENATSYVTVAWTAEVPSHEHEWGEWIYGVNSDTYWRSCKTCRFTETSDTKPGAPTTPCEHEWLHYTDLGMIRPSRRCMRCMRVEHLVLGTWASNEEIEAHQQRINEHEHTWTTWKRVPPTSTWHWWRCCTMCEHTEANFSANPEEGVRT